MFRVWWFVCATYAPRNGCCAYARCVTVRMRMHVLHVIGVALRAVRTNYGNARLLNVCIRRSAQQCVGPSHLIWPTLLPLPPLPTLCVHSVHVIRSMMHRECTLRMRSVSAGGNSNALGLPSDIDDEGSCRARSDNTVQRTRRIEYIYNNPTPAALRLSSTFRGPRLLMLCSLQSTRRKCTPRLYCVLYMFFL